MPFKQLIHCWSSLLLPSIFPGIRIFSSDSALPIRWPKYWSFSFSISLSNEYSGLISFGIDWFDLFAVQGTLKSLPSNTVQKHQFFGSQLSLWPKSHICTSLLEKQLVQFSHSVASISLWPRGMPGFPVHHQLPELAQTHVHQVGDAIQTSHPLFSPTPPAFSLSQHQGLF